MSTTGILEITSARLVLNIKQVHQIVLLSLILQNEAKTAKETLEEQK